MASNSNNYHFDLWAEYLTVTLSENVARCQLGSGKIKTIRITLSDQLNYPKAFKVILDNGLVVESKHQIPNSDHIYEIDYLYQSPCLIPFGKNITDPIAKRFCSAAKKIDSDFLSDNWSLNNSKSILSILRQLALRNVSHIISDQLQNQGIQMSDDFSLQYFDGSNYLSLSYDALRSDLVEQIQFYFKNSNIKQQAADLCFKHPNNKAWFNSLSSLN
jgi:hypothetical protein